MRRPLSDKTTPATPTFLVTVDVEDWFQVENFRSSISFSSWPSLELRVEKNVHRLLDLFDLVSQERTNSTRIEATFFVLGWLAERLPGLVREIRSRGHEVASHGFLHALTNEQNEAIFRQDLTDSKMLLEDIVGTQVLGYRAPSFSVSTEALKIIEDSGYVYDSSFNSFSVNSRYGHIEPAKYKKSDVILEVSKSFYEIAISNLKIGNSVLPWGGGGYFRLIPSIFFQMGVRSILKNEGAYVFYIHPWEIDKGQPRVTDVSALYKFRHYLNIDKTWTKLLLLLRENASVRFSSCTQYLKDTLGPENVIKD